MICRSTRTYCWTTIPCVRLPVRGVIIVHKAFTVACASQSVLENVDEAAFVMGKMEGTHQRTTPHALPKVPDAEPRVRVCSSSTSECSRSPQLVQRAGPGAPDHPRGVIFVEDAALRARGWTRVPQPPRLADQLDAHTRLPQEETKGS